MTSPTPTPAHQAFREKRAGKPLTDLSQVAIGTRLRIFGKSPKDNYGAVSVKKIILCETPESTWHEILINRSRNYYFHLENYLAGKSQWVDRVYVLDGKDRRLKGAALLEGK